MGNGPVPGLYRTLWASLPCERCGEERLTQVQFRTGKNDDLQEYRESDVLTQEKESSWTAGQLFKGQADGYCPSCQSLRHREEGDALEEAMATFIDEGRLIVSEGWLFKKHLASQAFRQRNQSRRRGTQWATLQTSSPFALLGTYSLRWDGLPAPQGSPAYGLFIETANDWIRDALSKKGWSQRMVIREDLWVEVTHDGQIQVVLDADMTSAKVQGHQPTEVSQAPG